MNQIEELTKLYAKTKEYKIPRVPIAGEVQATIQITPLSLQDAGLFDAVTKDNISPEAAMAAIYPLLAKSLAVPEADVKQLQIRYLTEIMEIIAGSNTTDDAEIKNLDKIKELMAARAK